MSAWAWDPSLYAGCAAHYRLGRLPYPPQLVEVMRRELDLDGRQRVLDLGCGPGSLTLPLAHHVATVVGVDADVDMVEEGRAEADRLGIGNVSWRHLRAEELPADLGPADVVCIAQSFHWFDRPTVAAILHEMLGPDGVLVHVQAITHRGDAGNDPLSRPRPPQDRVDALVRSYLGDIRRAGRGTLPSGTPGNESQVLRAVGFDGPRSVTIVGAKGGVGVGEAVRTLDEVVAAVFSLSSSAPHLFGDDLPRFEADLRALLSHHSRDGSFAERPRPMAIDIWRPSSRH